MLRFTQAGPSRLTALVPSPGTIAPRANARLIATSAPLLSGHSRWSKIRHRKGAADAARSKAWSGFMTAIHVALRKGPDPELNPDLAKALANAKSAGVPKDNVERAFARARKIADGSGKWMTFEGVGAGGKIALVVECVTDSPARTASRVKELLARAGCRVSPVGFLFERKGVVRVAPIEGQEGATFDALFEAALEGGAEDVREVETEDGMLWEVLSAPTDLGNLTTLLTSPPHDTLYSLQTSELAYIANDPVAVTEDGEGASVAEEKVETVMKGVALLEEENDVVRVWNNLE